MDGIFNMKLHDKYEVDRHVYVLRVPGGWIYYRCTSSGMTGVFVPFNDEFKK